MTLFSDCELTLSATQQFEKLLKDGMYAWPGGYPMYFISADGEPLSFEAAEANKELIKSAMLNKDDKQWQVVGFAINWEDANLHCSHTDKRIESAYAEED